MVGLNRIRMRHLANKGNKRAVLILRLLSNIDKLITTILVSNNFANIALSVIGTAIFVHLFGSNLLALTLATAVITVVILVFGEITPKIFAANNAERTALVVVLPLYLVILLLTPVVNIFAGLGNFIIHIFGGTTKRRSPLVTEEEIKLMIEIGKEEGVLGDEERKMLHRIFEFGDTLVADVMVPRSRIISVSVDSSAEELLERAVEEGHYRIPVYKDTQDNIIGIIYARDLLHIWKNNALIIIPDLIQPAYFVEKTKRVNELLREFQRNKIQIAIVIDKEKRAQGLVTLEDLIEEIVGEIEEAHIARKK